MTDAMINPEIMERANIQAAMCRCDETVSDRVMDVELCQVAAKKIAFWMAMAKQAQKG